MKIGILTFHNCFNYGAFVQVYALQEFLKKLGHDVYVINYKNSKFTLKEYKHFFCLKSIKTIFQNFIKIKNFKICQKELNTTKRVFNPKKLKNYYFDVVFFGSDSIWNYSNSLNINDFTYFGKYINTSLKASYAASFGPDKLSNGYPQEIYSLLKQFKYYGTRDFNSSKFIKNLFLDSDITHLTTEVLDPTFLFDFRKKIKPPINSNYILIYSYGLPEELVEKIKYIAKINNKKIISVGYYLDWCEINYPSVSPFDWVSLIYHADFIFTSMYHGTLLSIQLNKNFITHITPYRKNKINDILNKLDLNQRSVENIFTNVQSIYNTSINYTKIKSNIEPLLESSINYIRKVLRYAEF